MPAALIDCDVHPAAPPIDALLPYLSNHWREYVAQSHFKGAVDTAYPRAPTSARPGAAPPGETPGARVDQLRDAVLDPSGAEIAILNCAYALEGIHNPDLQVAMARAVNQWLVDHWLERDSRLRASIVVPTDWPDAAALEIDRAGEHPGFVQVFLPVRSAAPYGNRRYHPLFAAIERRGLVAGLHFGGSPGNPPTSAGWPSYYLEEYAGMPQAFQSQLMSMIVEGVFDRFPGLRVALLESGFAWLPAFLWRFDKDWKGLRREVPWNDRLPSAYVREHVRIALQPLDGPPEEARLVSLIGQLGSDDLLMYASDYPHWHDDHSPAAIPSSLGDGLRGKILSENARAFYRLGGGPP